MRAAGLWPGAGQAFAAKGLDPHHRADLVAVHVHIANAGTGGNLINAVVNAGVQTKGQAIAQGIDLIDKYLQIISRIAHHVQDRAKDFALYIGYGVNFKCDRSHKMTALTVIGHEGFPQHAKLIAHFLYISVNHGFGRRINHRANIALALGGRGDDQRIHGAGKHVDKGVGHVILYADQTARRTPLPGTVKGRGHDIADRLFQQGS